MTRAKTNEGARRIAEMKATFFETAAELWDEHLKEFQDVIEHSEEKTVNVSFTAELDLTESAPALETVLRFNPGIVTDRRKASFPAIEDPDQLVDPVIMEESEPKHGRRKK